MESKFEGYEGPLSYPTSPSMQQMMDDWLKSIQDPMVPRPPYELRVPGLSIDPPTLNLNSVPGFEMETSGVSFRQEVKTMSEEKTREQLQQEAYERLKNQEYMNEVAMPGVRRPVDPEDLNK